MSTFQGVSDIQSSSVNVSRVLVLSLRTTLTGYATSFDVIEFFGPEGSVLEEPVSSVLPVICYIECDSLFFFYGNAVSLGKLSLVAAPTT